MNRHYIINNQPKIISFMHLIGGMTEDNVLKCCQLELEQLIKLRVDEGINIGDSYIKRVI